MATWRFRKAGDKAPRDARPSLPSAALPYPSAPYGVESQGVRAAPSTRQPARWRRNLVLVVLLVLTVWLAWSWHAWREQALVGTAYAARAGCECRLISARPLATCEAEIKAGSGVPRAVSLSQDGGAVKASVPLLASQSADFRPDRGCQLEPWRD